MTEPRLLILETSSRSGQVALGLGSALSGVRSLGEARHHGRDLAPAVADLLANQGWKARDLQGVIVSRGPGSYTGLRVGIVSAKALAFATGCALLAIDTFPAIALQAPEEVERLDVISDAQKDRVYVQEFARSPGSMTVTPQGPLGIRPLAEWLEQRKPTTWVTGPGLAQYRQRLPESACIVESGLWYPQPASLLQLGLARYLAGERDDPWTVEPLYLRPSAAEEQWKK